MALGKNVLVVLTLGIILTSAISSSNVENEQIKNETNIQETIGGLEEDIEQGVIIQDGNIVDNDQDYLEMNNNLGSATNKIGNFIAKLVSTILEFFAKLFGSLLS